MKGVRVGDLMSEAEAEQLISRLNDYEATKPEDERRKWALTRSLFSLWCGGTAVNTPNPFYRHMLVQPDDFAVPGL